MTAAAVATAFMFAPAGAILGDADETGVLEVYYDSAGRVLYEWGIEPSNPTLSFVKHYLHYREPVEGSDHHRAGHGGGGDPPGGGGNDCTATQYRVAGWSWPSAYSATASSYASVLNTAGNTWDAETGANIFGGISSGSSATAGVQDFVNQMDWTSLGAGGTIAVTTTWYYTSTGEAVESDAQYNTYYNWATNGASNAMDVQSIGTHEIGHTFGLDHPSGNPNKIACLTMYAYGAYGETHSRTLGQGDINGIQAVYGA